MEARPWHKALAALLLLSSIPGASVAAGWTITPDITLTERYNDNTTLGASGRENSDFITQVTPGLRIDGSGPRFRASFDYRPSALFYARNSREDRLVNSLRAFGSLEAVENFFFVEAVGSITQNFISPFGDRPDDIAVVTANRTETRTFGLSPYIRGRLGQGHTYELRNRNTWTSSDTSALSNLHSTQWTGRLASPVRLLGWALEYEDNKLRLEQFTQQPDRETRLVRGRLYYQPDPDWRFSLSAGREQNNYQSLGETRSNSIYGAGVTWHPSARTTAELQYEHRFFGASRLARLQHRTRLTAWNLAYSRNISDSQRELLRLPPGDTAALLDAIFAARISDPLERAAAVEQFMRASGTPEFLTSSTAFYTPHIMLREHLEASAGILGVRNSLTFFVFASESTRLSEGVTDLVPDAFFLGDKVKQRGFGVRANHRVAPFTSVGASATRTYARQEEPTMRDSRNDSLAFTVNHTLSPKTTTFGGLSFTSVTTEDTGVTREARSVFVGVNHRF
jgi:uncharacterized protein (PEP-CTERM system associated)